MFLFKRHTCNAFCKCSFGQIVLKCMSHTKMMDCIKQLCSITVVFHKSPCVLHCKLHNQLHDVQITTKVPKMKTWLGKIPFLLKCVDQKQSCLICVASSWHSHFFPPTSDSDLTCTSVFNCSLPVRYICKSLNQLEFNLFGKSSLSEMKFTSTNKTRQIV